MEKVRLYVEEALLQGVSLVLSPRQSHYICSVMRLKENDNIFFFNGKDGEWLGETIGVSRKLVKATLKKCNKRQQYEEICTLLCYSKKRCFYAMKQRRGNLLMKF